jgi:hypothetical protein
MRPRWTDGLRAPTAAGGGESAEAVGHAGSGLTERVCLMPLWRAAEHRARGATTPECSSLSGGGDGGISDEHAIDCDTILYRNELPQFIDR